MLSSVPQTEIKSKQIINGPREIKSEDFNSIISEDVRNSTKEGTEQKINF